MFQHPLQADAPVSCLAGLPLIISIKLCKDRLAYVLTNGNYEQPCLKFIFVALHLLEDVQITHCQDKEENDDTGGNLNKKWQSTHKTPPVKGF
jgi:hypothetical protein